MLAFTLKNLKNQNVVGDCQQVFKESIMEEIMEDELNVHGHYLSHQAVIKDNSAKTKIHPVFYAYSSIHSSVSRISKCTDNSFL